jgi:hypothetical protein
MDLQLKFYGFFEENCMTIRYTATQYFILAVRLTVMFKGEYK